MSVNSNKIDDMSSLPNTSANKSSLPLACNCCVTSSDSDYSELGGNPKYICRLRYCCKWGCGVFTIVVLLLIIIAFAAYVPSIAQSAMDNSQLIQIYMSMSRPTNNSIMLNSTLQIVNSGQYDATLEATTATLLYKNGEIGTFKQPKISITANVGATFSLQTKLNINTPNGILLFRNMSGEILRGNDVKISFKAKPKIRPKLMGITMSPVAVNMNKDLIIKGALMQQAYIKNITNITGSKDGKEVIQDTEIEYSIATPFHLFGGRIEVDLYNADGVQLGFAMIPELRIVPGYNVLPGIKAHFAYADGNNASVDQFIMNYAGGVNQLLNMRGPKGDLVISHTMNSNATVYAYCYPDY